MIVKSPAPAIRFRDVRYLVAEGETVLDALLRQGAEVAHSCRKGSCHTCVLRCDEGDVHHDKAIDAAILDSGHILPCVARASGEVRLSPPELDRLSIAADIVSRRELGGGIFEIGIAPLKEMAFSGGQHLQIVRADGLSRSYSLASLPDEDFFFVVHVRRFDGGVMSQWLCVDADIGARVRLFTPQGDCHYRAEMAQRPLLLLATGSGAGAMAAVARDALASGHRASIALYHGVRFDDELYLHDTLTTLAQRHPNFSYVPCVSGALGEQILSAGTFAGRVTSSAFAAGKDLAETEVFLCGSPAMVEDARCLAVGAGAVRSRIHADPFEGSGFAPPRDAEKISDILADEELWNALGRGPGLTRILDAFYLRVYADERLSPFFHGLPRDQIVAKQYAFLADLFSGARNYFGMNPFNAHHWMVISDDLFDHREALFEQTLRDHGLPEPMIRRWEALHERFRAEIVKPVARGMVMRGEEQPLRLHEVDHLDIDTVCDGCGSEIPAGRPSRYQHRLGTLHCSACAGISASD